MSAIESPCIRICSIEQESGLCIGCGRTLAEIAGWMRISVEERRAVMAVLPARLEGMQRASRNALRESA
jgi:predicted Fe-S protein YdhL (DUF1289 family)